MGVVVAATHEQLDQRVALKFLRPDLVSNVEVVRRFMRESRAAVKIQSEHVARVLDVGTTDSGTPYMVMEYLDGEDLSQVLADRGALPVVDTVGYVLEACEAIAEAHSLGIVHRDLKPANLFLARRPSGRPIVKVLDFGISKVPAGGKDAETTSTTALMGSPVYMSPEQMVAPEKVDVRTDVWCLGVVLYELLSQKLPFEGETMPELVFKVVQNPHLPLLPVRPDLPEGLAAVIDRCLEKNQALRFANVAELAKALAPFASSRSAQSVERIQHLLGVAGSAVPSVRPRPVVAPRPDAQTFLPTTSQTSAPRSRMLLVPAALAVVAAVVLVGFFALRSARRPAVIPAPSTPAPPVSAPIATAEPSAAPSTVVLTLPSAEPSATTATAPSSSVPWWYGKPGDPHPHASAHPAASAPACHVVSYFDADGNKHFKKECP
jgi:serine/threonine-protein kinase